MPIRFFKEREAATCFPFFFCFGLVVFAPLVAADHPALVAEARTAVEFTFPSALGKIYRIEGSPDLVTWTTVEDGIPGNGAVIQRFYSTRDKPKQFLRVEEAAGP